MNKQRRFLSLLVLGFVFTFVFIVSPVQAQDTPAVYGIFFYSPTCPACHEVLDNHWPAIEERFGDQLRVLFVDVSGAQGSSLMQATRNALNIQSSGVPMLVLGNEVLVGSADIPHFAPQIIEVGLQTGGIAPPPVNGIKEVFDQVFPDAPVAATASSTSIPSVSVIDRFTADPIANSIAVVLLVGLVVSLLVVGTGSLQAFQKQSTRLVALLQGKARQSVLVILAIVGFALALSLLFGSLGSTWVALLAFVELLLFGVFAAFLLNRYASTQEFPVPLVTILALAGLGVAIYLAYVEITLSDAVCGTVGDCNAVQQSPYASIFGIPIAVYGIAMYVAVLAVIGLRQMTSQPGFDLLLVAFAVVGVAFSAYLTFLEPFVIGASCAWCLISAVVMLMLLWVVTPSVLSVPQRVAAR